MNLTITSFISAILVIGGIVLVAVQLMRKTTDKPVEQFRGLGTRQNGVCHLAAFLTDVPSRKQEIDCKLQSNSR